ncbi:MAG: undecaprenyl-diphosphate phosphatase [Holosporaceae bacterium]|nr:MAG: undecaprenyl-diphosphate phosphatase [Holosporaceae bacterium]
MLLFQGQPAGAFPYRCSPFRDETHRCRQVFFLTSIPIGVGALALLFRATLNDTFFYIGVDFFVILFACFCVGYGSLYFFMWWLRKNSLILFGLYRILLGAFVLLYFHA